jgi:hypothetical protein
MIFLLHFLLLLKNARNVYLDKNPIDNKSLSAYYLENKRYKVDNCDIAGLIYP